ncbi:proline-rich receptor-like protein kinase PERK2 [Triticum dicoccoides]|uniref:proline-rich receptor-like protein kinase PERK2 n=1 Tax=Triticum dicoccoides TaxID=85692 RepID=UPI001891ECCD|nr:proline-rich receptor-like protein kinase PERK2 [Triticum dicoccoides]
MDAATSPSTPRPSSPSDPVDLSGSPSAIDTFVQCRWIKSGSSTATPATRSPSSAIVTPSPRFLAICAPKLSMSLHALLSEPHAFHLRLSFGRHGRLEFPPHLPPLPLLPLACPPPRSIPRSLPLPLVPHRRPSVDAATSPSTPRPPSPSDPADLSGSPSAIDTFVRCRWIKSGSSTATPATRSPSSAIVTPSPRFLAICAPKLSTSHRALLDPETDADAPVIDYVDDDPSLPEQPDVRAQEPDATAGAYYCVETVDNQE